MSMQLLSDVTELLSHFFFSFSGHKYLENLNSVIPQIMHKSRGNSDGLEVQFRTSLYLLLILY